eukprot:s128_g6.t1
MVSRTQLVTLCSQCKREALRCTCCAVRFHWFVAHLNLMVTPQVREIVLGQMTPTLQYSATPESILFLLCLGTVHVPFLAQPLRHSGRVRSDLYIESSSDDLYQLRIVTVVGAESVWKSALNGMTTQDDHSCSCKSEWAPRRGAISALRALVLSGTEEEEQRNDRIRKLDLAIEAVTPKLQHEHWSVRRFAVLALCSVCEVIGGHRKGLKRVKEMATDPDEQVRLALAANLGRVAPLKSKEAVVTALQLASTDDDVEVRVAALLAVEELCGDERSRTRKAVRQVAALFADEEEETMGCGCCKDDKPHCSYNGEEYSETRKHCKRPDPNGAKQWTQGIGAACGVEDWSLNPIIEAPGLNWIVGDPTVLQVDKEIIMFTNGALGGIQRYVAQTTDPTFFEDRPPALIKFGTVRPYIFHDQASNTVTLFYEKLGMTNEVDLQYSAPLLFQASYIAARQAKVGEWKFGRPKKILLPTLDWEKEGQFRIGNPFVYYNKVKGKYWLYYSCGAIRLDDSAIDEPKYFGLAESDPRPSEAAELWVAVKNPLADITEDGCGVALCNRLTLDESTGVSGSTISMIKTTDGGLSWDTVIPKFIGPSLVEDDWKAAYVYAFDTLINPLDSNTELIYYNARNGYKDSDHWKVHWVPSLGHFMISQHTVSHWRIRHLNRSNLSHSLQDAFEEAGVSRFPVEFIQKARSDCFGAALQAVAQTGQMLQICSGYAPDMLQISGPPVRLTAKRVICAIGRERRCAVDALTLVLKDPNEYARLLAADTFKSVVGKLEPRALKRTMRLVRRSSVSGVREAAAKAMAFCQKETEAHVEQDPKVILAASKMSMKSFRLSKTCLLRSSDQTSCGISRAFQTIHASTAKANTYRFTILRSAMLRKTQRLRAALPGWVGQWHRLARNGRGFSTGEVSKRSGSSLAGVVGGFAVGAITAGATAYYFLQAPSTPQSVSTKVKQEVATSVAKEKPQAEKTSEAKAEKDAEKVEKTIEKTIEMEKTEKTIVESTKETVPEQTPEEIEEANKKKEMLKILQDAMGENRYDAFRSAQSAEVSSLASNALQQVERAHQSSSQRREAALARLKHVLEVGDMTLIAEALAEAKAAAVPSCAEMMLAEGLGVSQTSTQIEDLLDMAEEFRVEPQQARAAELERCQGKSRKDRVCAVELEQRLVELTRMLASARLHSKARLEQALQTKMTQHELQALKALYTSLKEAEKDFDQDLSSASSAISTMSFSANSFNAASFQASIGLQRRTTIEGSPPMEDLQNSNRIEQKAGSLNFELLLRLHLALA